MNARDAALAFLRMCSDQELEEVVAEARRYRAEQAERADRVQREVRERMFGPQEMEAMEAEHEAQKEWARTNVPL